MTITMTKPRKTRAAKPINQLVIVGREDEISHVNYYIQSGEQVYVPVLKNGKAVECKRLNGEACESWYYSPRGHKHCKHSACAEQNEQERSADQHVHVQDDLYPSLHSCYSCGYRVKHAGYCHKCS